MLYEKEIKSFKQINKNDEEENVDETNSRTNKQNHKFKETHPGTKFSYLKRLKLPVIPQVSLPHGKLCPLEELELNSECPTRDVTEKRELYAKMALLMFHPFRELEDLKNNGSYWKTFSKQLKNYIEGNGTTFWRKGFEILQNIQDRLTMDKHLQRARDPISLVTTNEKPDDEKTTRKRSNDDTNVMDILQLALQNKE